MKHRVVSFVSVLALAAACGGDFDPESKVDSVRVFASRATAPYAKPGEQVTVEVLAVDQRADRSRPMKLYWIPILCENPKNDAYYACFSGVGGAGGGGGGGGGGFGALKTGIDLSPFLQTGPKYTFTMPADAVTSHPLVPGLDSPYGLVVLFNVACAGHLEIAPIDPSGSPQQVPIGCFDADHNPLDPSQYVIGYTRVYAYDTRTNLNPVLDTKGFRVKLGGATDFAVMDLAQPIVLPRCTTELRRDCPVHKLDAAVTAESWEVNPGDRDASGAVRHEQVWADYYASGGQLQGGARLLYDPARGKIDGTEIGFQAPNEAGDQALWVVVHDNRGGVDWLEVTLRIQ